MHLWHPPSFCSRCFLFGLSPLTTSYISPVVAIHPSGKTWNRVRCSPSLSSPILIFCLCHSSISQSLASAQCVLPLGVFPLGVFSTRCVFRLVCFPLGVASAWCVSTWCVSLLGGFLRSVSPVACLTTHTSTVQLSPTCQSTDPDFVQKGPSFNRSLFAACLSPSFHRLRDSRIAPSSLG